MRLKACQLAHVPSRFPLDLESLQLATKIRDGTTTQGQTMNISEAAAQSGLSVDTIRFYEKTGMMPRPQRDARGWRRFDADTLNWLIDLERLRATGMPMAEMRRFAELVHARGAAHRDAAEERLGILRRHADRLDARERDLAACRSFLDRKIAFYQRMKDTA